MSNRETTERPAASGHRFGPDLTCSECGISWDAHKREPAPCHVATLAGELESAAERLVRLSPLDSTPPGEDP